MIHTSCFSQHSIDQHVRKFRFHYLWFRVISDFRLEVSENCPLGRYYTASRDNFLPTFRYHVQG